MYRAQYGDRQIVAKRIHPGSTEDEQLIFAKEAKLLGTIKHPNIVTLIGVCEEPDICIIMEFLQFSLKPFKRNRFFNNLDDLSYMNRERILFLFPKIGYFMARDIIKAVAYLHSENMVHRDIKPANVLISNAHYTENTPEEEIMRCPIICKLGDLGESRSIAIKTRNVMRNTKNLTANINVVHQLFRPQRHY